MTKPKILHIGGAHSVHVVDLVKELHKLGYPQCVFSYREESIVPKGVGVYNSPYTKFFPNNLNDAYLHKLELVIARIIAHERPNIIHAHFPLFTCVPAYLAQRLTHLPLYLTPWSNRELTKGKVLHSRINLVIKHTKHFLIDTPWEFSLYKKCYSNLLDSMYVSWRLPLDLSAFHDLTENSKDVSTPKILSARVMQPQNYQELLVRALPIIFSKYPTATATLIVGQSVGQGYKYFKQMQLVAERLGIADRCNFIGQSLSQEAFSELIKQHNIVFSMADSDIGGSQTTNKSAYSGAITIVKKYAKGHCLLVPGENVLSAEATQEDVLNKLLFAIENMKGLSHKFFEANRKLKVFSSEYMLSVLTKLYDKEI